MVWLGLVLIGSGLASVEGRAAELRAGVRTYRQQHEVAIVRELADLVSIPNRAADSLAIRRNADFIVAMLQRRGVQARRLEAANSPPAVLGELAVPGARHTLLLYAHYDGQPVDAAQWSSDPWTPVLRDAPLDQGGKEVAWSSLRDVAPDAAPSPSDTITGPAKIRPGPPGSPLEGMVIDELTDFGVFPVTVCFPPERSDHLGVAVKAAFP